MLMCIGDEHAKSVWYFKPAFGYSWSWFLCFFFVIENQRSAVTEKLLVIENKLGLN